MALIVETGAIVAGAESYISVSGADTYHSDRGNASWAALTTAVKEQNLRKATEYMLQVYRQRWKGSRMSSGQTLDWPRAFVYIDQILSGSSYAFPSLVSNTVVPVEVQRACAELALKSSTAELLADLTQQKASVTVGPISTTYDSSSPQFKRYTAIDAMLSPYFEGVDGKAVRV